MTGKKSLILRIIAAVVALFLILGCTVLMFGNDSERTKYEVKTIFLKVTDSGGKTVSYKLETNEIYLKGALLTDDFASGEQREEGFVLGRVGDITADEKKNEHWRIYINGEVTAKKCDKIKLWDENTYALKLEY